MAARGIQNSDHIMWDRKCYFSKSETKTKMKIFTDSKKLQIFYRINFCNAKRRWEP